MCVGVGVGRITEVGSLIKWMDSCHPHHPPVNPYAHKELDWKEVICITSFFWGGGAVFWCCLPFTSGFHSLLVRWSLTTQCCLATALWCLIIPFTGEQLSKVTNWSDFVTLRHISAVLILVHTLNDVNDAHSSHLGYLMVSPQLYNTPSWRACLFASRAFFG